MPPSACLTPPCSRQRSGRHTAPSCSLAPPTSTTRVLLTVLTEPATRPPTALLPQRWPAVSTGAGSTFQRKPPSSLGGRNRTGNPNLPRKHPPFGADGEPAPITVLAMPIRVLCAPPADHKS